MEASLVSAISFGYAVLKDSLKLGSKYVKAPHRAAGDKLSTHIRFIESWYSSVHMFGMTESIGIDESTIEISLTKQPRKFRSGASSSKSVSEDEILDIDKSCIILGDPGSGKTTILKRLIRKLILSPPVGERDTSDFPMLVLGRNISNDRGIFEFLFEGIGFELVSDGDLAANEIKTLNDKEKRQLIRECVRQSFDNASIAIFIDGVDEIEPTSRKQFEEDVQYLQSMMIKGKAILTCRSGDWLTSLQGFDVLEMCALSEGEVFSIVRLWANKYDAFISAIAVVPYRDILDRPLFLTILIVVFNQTGNLPESPFEVYHRVINLLIEKWDSQRRVERLSRYKGFFTERKFKFLCSIAFNLISQSLTRFPRLSLQLAFEETAPHFGFEPWEMQGVVQEIESHTGIIVESGFDHFEFCHLTIQEFLAATQLITVPKSEDRAMELIKTSPSTVAVAVCLSGNPTEYFAFVITRLAVAYLRRSNMEDSEVYNSVRSFFRRLYLERPIFTADAMMGGTLILTISLYDKLLKDSSDRVLRDAIKELNFLLDGSLGRESVKRVLRRFSVDGQENGDIKVYIGPALVIQDDTSVVSRITMSARMVSLLQNSSDKYYLFEALRPV